MSPFLLLQIAADADEREIKRAYARLLKRTRPDEDAAAFQRLQEAYARCLDIARMRATCAVGDGGDDNGVLAVASDPVNCEEERWCGPAAAPHAAPEPVAADADDERDAFVPHERHFDVAAFVASMHELLEQPDPRRMQDWLYAQEALYSVHLKQVLRPAVVHAIDEAPRIRDSRVLEKLLAFFGLDQLDRDGLAERVQASLDRRYQGERLDNVVRYVDSPQSWLNRRIAGELAGQWSALRRLLLLLVPMVPTRIRDLLDQLQQIDPGLRHRKLDPGAVAFWSQVSDPIALSRPRLVMIALRVVVWNAAIFGFVALVMRQDYPDIARIAGIWMAASAGLWAAWAACKWVWFHGAHWAIQRLDLLPDEYDAAFSSLLGAALSWMLGQNPVPLLIGGVRGHVFMIRSMSGLPRIASILMALAYPMGWVMLTLPLQGRMEVDTRMTLVLTLAVVPLLVAPFVRQRRLVPVRWSSWLVTQAIATAAVFGALLLF